MIKVFSYGGGVQSTAALVLAVQGKIDYQTFLFCNVGEDSENPATMLYVHDVAMPYAQQHGITLIELQKHLRDGSTDTVYQRITRPHSRSIGIPIRMANGAPGNRTCTFDFKVSVIDKWLREQGAKKQGATVGLGITLDEIGRVKPNMDENTIAWKENAWPLIFDMKPPLSRQDCMNIISQAGLPVPPKSSCYFCPFHTVRVWQEMRHAQPDLFQKACDLEQFINERRKMLGRDEVWLTGKLKPLAQVTTEYQQGDLFEDDQGICESGYCMM